jgi:hypothetical protein
MPYLRFFLFSEDDAAIIVRAKEVCADARWTTKQWTKKQVRWSKDGNLDTTESWSAFVAYIVLASIGMINPQIFAYPRDNLSTFFLKAKKVCELTPDSDGTLPS